jgi:hypothetical protein
MLCNVCSHSAEQFAKANMLGKYDICYYQCIHCGFVQTELPYWLDEAYSNVINRSDIGLVMRNLKLSQLTHSVICTFFDNNGKFVDYGGGYGLFVRLMRDKGMRFYRYDPMCENLFANSFDADLSGKEQYTLATAFEVFEHLVKPIDEIQKILRFAPSIFFSTTLLPSDRPKPNEWWYYGLEHGQHVSIYSRKSLEIIAEIFSLQLYSNGRSYHLLTNKSFPHQLYRLAANYKFSKILNLLVRHHSLLEQDYYEITGNKLD